MPMLWVRALSSVAVLLAVAGEDSCPAGAGASCKADPGAAVAASKQTRASKADQQPSADLITQEVDQLKALVELCDERIELLKEFHHMVNTGVNLSVPDSHARMLKEQLPLVSEIIDDEDKGPTGSADDYLISKAVIPQETPIHFIKWLPLRNPRTGSSSSAPAQMAMPSVLLVAVPADGAVKLFSHSGELILSFASGHEHTITNLAVSQSQDEYNIMTADAGGVVRVHKVHVRQRRLTKDQRQARRNSSDEKQSQFLGSQVNVTAQFTKQMQVPIDGEQAATITAMALASQQGNKYFVVGDDQGKIGVFNKNGTFVTSIDASVTPGAKVEGLYSYLSNLIFRTGDEWGYVELGKQEIHRVGCQGFDGSVTAVAFDSQQASRVLIADEEGTVWVLNMKDKRNCKVEHHFPKGSTSLPLELASIKGFGLALERAERNGEANSLLALNMSHVGRRPEHLQGAPSPISWRQGRSPVRDWSVHKRYQAGDLLAFLSEDGLEIEVAELLMSVYQAPAQDQFGNFKMPVIGVAIVLVLGYQYMKNKGGGGAKFGGRGGGGGKGKFDNMDFSALRNKTGGRRGGLGALGGRKGLGGLGGRRGF